MAPPILSKPSKAATPGHRFRHDRLLAYGLERDLVRLDVQPPARRKPVRRTSDAPFYWCAIVFFSGLTLFVIGFALGSIGRAARRAEMPPEVSARPPTAQPAVTRRPVQPNSPAVVLGQPPVAVQPVAKVPPVATTAPTARVR